MQFYPHNLPISTVGFATSASLAELTTYLNNFQSISVTVNTASVALNITGSAGTAGSNFIKTGERGATGATGVQGYRGNSLYILSASWNAGVCTPSACYAHDFGYGEYVPAYSGYTCYFGSPTTLYSKDVPPETALTPNSSVLYSNPTCTTLAINLNALAYGPTNTVHSTNGSGVLSLSLGSCTTGF